MTPRLHSRGLTLIELLIVVAILAIMSGSILDMQVHLLRQQAKEQLEAVLADSCQSVVETLARDLGRADVVALPAQGADGATLPAEEAGGALLRMRLPADPGDPAGATLVEYRLRGGDLLVSRTYERPAEPALSQTMAQCIEHLTLERRGNLLCVAVQCGGRWATQDVHSDLRTEFLVTKWRDLP